MLTECQQATYPFIRSYHQRRGCTPKLIEIADGIGISSKGVMHCYLKAILRTAWKIKQNKDGTVTLLPVNQTMQPINYLAERI
ncbi:MAG: hypothetical protein KZQ88_06575 [Candidatus Thiodiazotropha sp. (ex Dulcina madagascariensis)]|nr:hypothetical protein [Candidatus Thiodiazotropha sp. (ex Epidulcina cf. delphinae)]MCU7922347.1 hypothetical protein [Candidatus Thiodiazotropha sp. (ex Dulcina madagascariensis)]MCU7925300.1 hypothetical protein [Candidatus Thiodiazotropha sp. (ex Dulcina madagascariensis)]